LVRHEGFQLEGVFMTGPRWPSRILNLRCNTATELISQQLDGPLSLVDRAALGGHLLACPPCRRFRRQIHFLQAACRRRGPLFDPDETEALSDAGRRRILRAIRDAPGSKD
jgi:predicted anti-sigma-YlaC factor YlaD